MKITVYVATCSNGKQYVGQTIQHLNARATSHHILDIVDIRALARTCSQTEACRLESFWMERLRTMWPNGLNRLPANKNGLWKRPGVLKKLARRNAKIIAMRQTGMTFREIAKRFEISVAHARNISCGRSKVSVLTD